MKDPFTLRSRGFGFITFCSPTSLDKVLAVSSHLLDGKKIDPKPATPKAKSKEAKTRKIFVGGVSQDTSAEEGKKYFSQHGRPAGEEAGHDSPSRGPPGQPSSPPATNTA